MDESKIQKSIEGHLARNRELKKLIANKGVDPEKKRIIDLHFWASSEGAANDLALALKDAGHGAASRGRVDGSDLWNVETQVEASPLAVTTPFFVERLVRLAADHDAEFDGWGTAI